MTKILIDASQTIIAACTTTLHDSFSRDNPESKGLAKHIALNSIVSLKKRFNGEPILCYDGRGGYWRKDVYAYYKGHRKHRKEASTFDWEYMYEIMNELRDDFIAHFPYKVIQVDKCEADDVIASLVKYFNENELVQEGLIEVPVPIVIVSTDKDFLQLQKFRNVKQWNNITKKMMVSKNPARDLIEKIIQGDTGDNIPNICTPDTWGKARANDEPARQVPFKVARLNEFYKKYIDACTNDSEKANFSRNKCLIDFEMIPSRIYDRIISAYIEHEVKGSKGKVFNYLCKNKFKMLLKNVNDF